LQKFTFPSRGFHIVAQKVGEADYFLEKLKDDLRFSDEFAYILSAFASAARSITFSLQAVMSGYPGFVEWYSPQQAELRKSKLARYFVDLRNLLQKVGEVPVAHEGWTHNGKFEKFSYFIDSKALGEAPAGDVMKLSKEYFVLILRLVESCYRHYRIYVDPRMLFTSDGLNALGWTIEDLEEAVGIPRGWTDVPYEGDDKEYQRLRLLSRQFQGDEVMEQYFLKYGFKSK
jgi:hypothetical protein